MFILIALVVLAIALAFIPGAGIIAIVPAFIAVAYLVWLAVALMSGNTPGRALRRAEPGPDLERDGAEDPARDSRA